MPARYPKAPTRYDFLAEEYRHRCAARIKAAREAAQLSTTDLAKAAGIPSASLITHWERDGVLPALPRMFAVAVALDTTMEALFGFAGINEDDQGARHG